MTPISAGGGVGGQLIINGNGIDRTLSYYLRPIGSASELVVRYDASLETDPAANGASPDAELGAETALPAGAYVSVKFPLHGVRAGMPCKQQRTPLPLD